MVFRTLRLAKFLFFVGVWLSSSAWGLNLGNIQVVSQGGQPFLAKIAIIANQQELSQLSGFKVQFPSSEVYQQYGLTIPKEQVLFSLGIEKNANQLPSAIVVSSETIIPEQTLFNDIVVELSWNGGKLIRVYTILNAKEVGVIVNKGDSLSKITQSLMPELPQANFEQTLTAIFRLNPKAFIAGNIHRLRVGAQLTIPTAAMVDSIPKEEAKKFAIKAQDNFDNQLFSQPTEMNEGSSEGFKRDRLLLSSSEKSSDKKVLEAKLEEELIAQQKILEQAQARIAELQKNITALKESSVSKNQNTFVAIGNATLWKIGVLIGLLGIFVYGNFFRKNATGIAGNTLAKNTVDEIPEFAKNIFATLNLDLDSPIGTTTSSQSLSNLKGDKPTIAINQPKPHRNIPSVSDQKLRLNLAKSYIKINDYPTARILLQELVSLGSNGQSDIVREAQKYLLQIA